VLSSASHSRALQNNGEGLAFSKAVSILVCPLDIPAAGDELDAKGAGYSLLKVDVEPEAGMGLR